jgi:hypothetical protein
MLAPPSAIQCTAGPAVIQRGEHGCALVVSFRIERAALLQPSAVLAVLPFELPVGTGRDPPRGRSPPRCGGHRRIGSSREKSTAELAFAEKACDLTMCKVPRNYSRTFHAAAWSLVAAVLACSSGSSPPAAATDDGICTANGRAFSQASGQCSGTPCAAGCECSSVNGQCDCTMIGECSNPSAQCNPDDVLSSVGGSGSTEAFAFHNSW